MCVSTWPRLQPGSSEGSLSWSSVSADADAMRRPSASAIRLMVRSTECGPGGWLTQAIFPYRPRPGHRNNLNLADRPPGILVTGTGLGWKGCRLAVAACSWPPQTARRKLSVGPDTIERAPCKPRSPYRSRRPDQEKQSAQWQNDW